MESHDKITVFISYSHKNAAIADEIVEHLESSNFRVLIDRRDLPYGEKWQKVLLDFIREADAVIWLLSPSSLQSKWCNWEVGEVKRLRKRLIPVHVDQVSIEEMSSDFSDLHILPSDGLFRLNSHFRQLIEALQSDWSWLREHTRLSALFERWVDHKKASTFLLSESDLSAVGKLLESKPTTSMTLPNAFQKFREESRSALENQKRSYRRMAGVGFVKPSISHFENREYDAAIKFSIAGIISSNDRSLELVPELRSPLAKSLFELRTERIIESLQQTRAGFTFCHKTSVCASVTPENEILLFDIEGGTELGVFSGHPGTIEHLSFSASGKLLASSCKDSVLVWEIDEQKQLHSFKGVGDFDGGSLSADIMTFESNDKSLAFAIEGRVLIADMLTGEFTEVPIHNGPGAGICSWSPNGRQLVLSSGTRAHFHFFDLELGEAVNHFQNDHDPMLISKFTMDGSKLITGSGEGAIVLWDVQNGSTIREFLGHNDIISSLNLTKDEKRIISTSFDGTARIWNLESGDELHLLSGHTDKILSGTISPDDEVFVTGSSDRTVRIWDITTGECFSDYKDHVGAISNVEFSSTGKKIVSAGTDNTVRIWRPFQSHEIMRFGPHPTYIRNSQMSRKLETLLTTSDKTVFLWQVKDGRLIRRTSGEYEIAFSAMNNNGSQLFCPAEDGIFEFDINDGKHSFTYDEEVGSFMAPVFAPGGRYFAVVPKKKSESQFDKLCIIDTKERCIVSTAEADCPSNPADIRFSPDGKFIGALVRKEGDAYFQNVAKLWKMPGLELVGIFGQEPFDVSDLCFSDIENTIATVERTESKKYVIRVRKFQNEESYEEFYLPNFGFISDVRFCPRGKYIFSKTGIDIHLWDLDGDNKPRTLSGHTDYVLALAFSDDGRRLASAGHDCTIRIWDIDNASEIACLFGHEESVRSLKFCEDGECLLSHSDDGTARIWDIGRTVPIVENFVELVACAVSQGVGRKSNEDHGDVLLSSVNSDMVEDYFVGLETRKSSEDFSKSFHDYASMRQPNCYLTPSQRGKIIDANPRTTEPMKMKNWV